MDNKNKITPDRIEQLKTMINNRVNQNLIYAENLVQDKKAAVWDFQKDLFKYMELFEFLDDFAEHNYKIFDFLEHACIFYVEKGEFKKPEVISSLLSIMGLVKDIFAKQDFIREKKEDYYKLAAEFEELE